MSFVHGLIMFLIDILQKRTDSASLKKHAVDIMKTRTMSFEYTKSVLVTLEKQVEDEIHRLGGNTALEGIVHALSLKNVS